MSFELDIEDVLISGEDGCVRISQPQRQRQTDR